MSPVVREDGSGSNTYNIEAISSSDSDSESDNSGEANSQPASGALNTSNDSDQEIPADLNDNAEYVFSNSSSNSTRSSSDDNSLQEDESSLLPDH